MQHRIRNRTSIAALILAASLVSCGDGGTAPENATIEAFITQVSLQ
jgi:hypothetical protein